jgi:2-hydroxy-3-oxopropionate reductase
MGSAIAGRLIDRGLAPVVFDIDRARVDALVTRGATGAASPAELTAKADHVVLSLNTAAIVEAAVFGQDGVATTAAADKLLIDMSSIDPLATIELATRLSAETGMAWTDHPLSGGVPGAESGTLTIMAGGSEVDFERAGEVMQHLAANRTLMGPVGAGQTTKLINQMIVGNGFATLMECAELAVRGGVDPAMIPPALAGGRADSAILQEFFVKLATRDYSPTGRIDNMLKDLDSAQQFARRADVATPLLNENVELHRWLVDQGHGPSDTAAMMEFHGPREATDSETGNGAGTGTGYENGAGKADRA